MEDFPMWLKLMLYLIVAGTFLYGLFAFVQLLVNRI